MMEDSSRERDCETEVNERCLRLFGRDDVLCDLVMVGTV